MANFVKKSADEAHFSKLNSAPLECWGIATPEYIRNRWYPNVRPHPATELIALRTGTYTARLCRACAKAELAKSYPGGPWWTRAGCCAVCGIEVYLNPAETWNRTRHPDTKLLCKSSCGRTPRVSARAMQEAELRAEREAAEARRRERQRTDQLIAELWPEQEAFK